MSVPGDRRDATCRGCGAKIVMIFTAAGGKWAPCEALPSHVDGERVLVFANGEVGRHYGNYEGGHESHFAHCSKAGEFRKKQEQKKTAEQPAKEDHWVVGCGCLTGEVGR